MIKPRKEAENRSSSSSSTIENKKKKNRISFKVSLNLDIKNY
jgi:hypothetical protein